MHCHVLIDQLLCNDEHFLGRGGEYLGNNYIVH